MKVRTYGFIWEPHSGRGVDEFLKNVKTNFPQAMAELSSPKSEKNDVKRLLAVSEFQSNWAGVLLTVKNAKKFITSQNTPEGLKITTRKLEANNRMVDVNLFVINPKTGRGLYQHYHGSAFVTTFCGHCDNLYHQFFGKTDKAARLSHSLYLTPSDYAERIQALKSVNHVEYEFQTLHIPNNDMVPAKNRAKRLKHKVFYDYRLVDQGLIKDLVHYVKQNLLQFRRFNITGRDTDDNEVTYRIDQPSVFSEIEFEDLEIDFELKHKDVEAALRGSNSLQQLIRQTKRPEVEGFFNVEVSE